MRTIPIQFKSFEIKQYDPRTQKITFSLIVNDGKDNEMRREIEISKINAQQIITEATTKIKQKNMSRATGNIIDDLTSFKLMNDDEYVEKLERFLEMFMSQTRSLKSSRLSYIDIQKQAEGKKFEWH